MTLHSSFIGLFLRLFVIIRNHIHFIINNYET